MPQRKLAYAATPGVVHPESCWVESRRSVFGETKEQAEAEVNRLIEAKTIIVIEPT